MDRLKNLFADARFYFWLALEFCLTHVKQNPVKVATVGILVLAVVQVFTGTAVVGRSTQKAVENVCELLLLLGLGDTLDRDIKAQTNERRAAR